MTALEAISVLNAGNIVTRSPLDVVVFSNEEGGLIGSLADDLNWTSTRST